MSAWPAHQKGPLYVQWIGSWTICPTKEGIDCWFDGWIDRTIGRTVASGIDCYLGSQFNNRAKR